MKHRQHMILCGIAVLIAFMLLARRGASPLAAGFGFALLLCPIVMGTVMWLLMRQTNNPSPPSAHHEINKVNEPHDNAASSRRS